MNHAPNLFDDRQMQQFLVKGYAAVQTELAPSFHAAMRQRALDVIETEGNPGNNLIPRIPELQQLFDDPQVVGALTSVLGPRYFLQPHRYCHLNAPGSAGQRLHRDGFFTRRHHMRWALALYYPQDTTEAMGPTGIVPGSHYYNTQPVPGVGQEIPLLGAAGTMTICDFHIWHRATPNQSEQPRLMMKFLLARMEEPREPAWRSAGGAWAAETPVGHPAMWQHLWDWHRGEGNGRAPAGEAADERSTAELVAALADESELVGLGAAYALSARGAAAVPALIAVLRDEEDASRWHTIHEKVNDGHHTRSTTANASYALAAIGAAAVPELIAEAADGHWWARASAAETLGDIGGGAGEALPALGRLATDEHVAVRRHAAEALGVVGQGQRTAALQAVAVPPLIQALRDEEVKVRRSAALSLARIGPAAEEAVPALTAGLKDEDRYVRANGAHALRRIGTAAAIETLLGFLETSRWCPITTKKSPY